MNGSASPLVRSRRGLVSCIANATMAAIHQFNFLDGTVDATRRAVLAHLDAGHATTGIESIVLRLLSDPAVRGSKAGIALAKHLARSTAVIPEGPGCCTSLGRRPSRP